MRRIAVVGCSGSGKTTLAGALARSLACPHIELDSIYHQPGWTPLGHEEFRRRVQQATEPSRWVVEGNYSIVRDIVWGRADTVVWLDLPFATVMTRTVRRTVRRTIRRTELWNGNREPFSNLWSINPEKSIIAWSATRHRKYRRQYGELARDPDWSALAFVRLESTAAIEVFLHGLTHETPEGGVP